MEIDDRQKKEDVEKGTCLLEWDFKKGDPPAPLLKHKYGSERRKAKIMNFSLAYVCGFGIDD